MHLIGILGEAGSGKDTAGKLLVQEHGFYSLALADPIKVFCMWMFGWDADRLWGPSESRNAPDLTLPFVRCPSCGHFPCGETVNMDADSVTCDICASLRDPREWEGFLSARFALQHLGTEWARALRADCHIDFAIKRANLVQQKGITYDPLWHVIPGEVLEQRFVPEQQAGRNPTPVYISDCRFKNEVRLIQSVGGHVYRIRRRGKEDNTTTGISGHASEMEQRGIADEDLDGIIENHGTLDALGERLRSIVKPEPKGA